MIDSFWVGVIAGVSYTVVMGGIIATTIIVIMRKEK